MTAGTVDDRRAPTPARFWPRQHPSVVTTTIFADPSQTQALASSQQKHVPIPVVPIVLGVLGGVIIVCIVAAGWLWCGRTKKAKQRSLSKLSLSEKGASQQSYGHEDAGSIPPVPPLPSFPPTPEGRARDVANSQPPPRPAKNRERSRPRRSVDPPSPRTSFQDHRSYVPVRPSPLSGGYSAASSPTTGSPMPSTPDGRTARLTVLSAATDGPSRLSAASTGSAGSYPLENGDVPVGYAFSKSDAALGGRAPIAWDI
ncbi:hypothetical protein BOTBODRAFT_29364 [Botryobasidium botryosum FD-172 SS1]|uniref:Uncharacterized protein n=1 Tax=Botryobasidium botryosum (strain FD-172 SS1) TaxID=930990 RepID=A0A067MR35_BOTB1|nr:hypothetical protein BOTBODRAFT_29364 [Botryobasidium botryosum FD-172 SS1]